MITPAAAFALSLLVLFSGCSEPAEPPRPAASIDSGPVAIKGSSDHLVVEGQYQPLALDRIERLSVEPGTLMAHGATTSVAIDLPPSANTEQPTRNWAITTEADIDGRRVVTFTHNETIEEFTLELPPTQAALQFGVFAGRSGGEVLVFTWNGETGPYWGYVTIAKKDPQGEGSAPPPR